MHDQHNFDVIFGNRGLRPTFFSLQVLMRQYNEVVATIPRSGYRSAEQRAKSNESYPISSIGFIRQRTSMMKSSVPGETLYSPDKTSRIASKNTLSTIRKSNKSGKISTSWPIFSLRSILKKTLQG